MTSDAASTQPGQKGGSPCSASEAVVEERSSMSFVANFVMFSKRSVRLLVIFVYIYDICICVLGQLLSMKPCTNHSD